MEKINKLKKILISFGIIGLISLLGELLHDYIPLPVPASVYGLVLLFIALVVKVIKLDWIESGADILVAIMPLLFVPSVVKIVTLQEMIMGHLIEVLLVIACSSVVVMVVTGKVAQKMIERQEKE